MKPHAVIVTLLVCILVCLASCTVRRAPGGGIQVIPDLGDNPGYGGIWRKTTINGQCVWTNGTYCLLCGEDISEIVPCSEILNQPVNQPGAQQAAAAVESLQQVFYRLTGGLSGPEWLVMQGWIDWEEGQAIDEIPIRVEDFNDNNTPQDETDDYLNVSILWYSKFALPDLGNLPQGVAVYAYFDGDGYDDEHDMLLLRLAGPSLEVQTALENLIEPGTCFTIEVPSAGFAEVFCR